MQRLKQDAAQAKQEKQTLGARLDSATATLKKAREQLRRSEDGLAQAQKRHEEAANAVEDAEEELARLKEKAAEGVELNAPSVFAEAQALLAELERAPLCSSVSNQVVPEALLAQMRALREALAVEGVEQEPLHFHVDTPEASDAEECEPGRSAERATAARRRTRSDTPTRLRLHSSSRTPPPATRR